MLKIISVQKNNKLDQAAIELNSINGEVAKAQSELAEIIKNKKRISDEAEKESKEFEDNFSARK